MRARFERSMLRYDTADELRRAGIVTSADIAGYDTDEPAYANRDHTILVLRGEGRWHYRLDVTNERGEFLGLLMFGNDFRSPQAAWRAARKARKDYIATGELGNEHEWYR